MTSALKELAKIIKTSMESGKKYNSPFSVPKVYAEVNQTIGLRKFEQEGFEVDYFRFGPYLSP